MGWFVRLMEELGITCRVGHPATIRTAEARRQKHDRRHAQLLLRLLVEDRFPAIWMPMPELRDLRALLLHRHQWVRMRTRVQGALHAIALGHDVRRRGALWGSEGQAVLAAIPLVPHAAHRRDELKALYRHLDAHVDQLDDRVRTAAARHYGSTRTAVGSPPLGPYAGRSIAKGEARRPHQVDCAPAVVTFRRTCPIALGQLSGLGSVRCRLGCLCSLRSTNGSASVESLPEY